MLSELCVRRPVFATMLVTSLVVLGIVSFRTITESVANIIVVERATAEGVAIGCREYFRIGLPVTVLTLAFGTVWLWAFS